MSTWRTVFKLEWRILRRDRAAMAILGIFAAFLTLSALAGGRHAGALAEGLEASASAERAHLEALGAELETLLREDAAPRARDPRDPMWIGKEGAARLAVLPPAPLAPVAVGLRDLQPQAVRVNAEVHLGDGFRSETAMAGPTRLTSGAFDPAFIFVVLFPLVIIALSYELLSGERERGTLAMLLSQPISQGALVLGKAGARAVALCGVTLAFALAGLVIAGVAPQALGAPLHLALYGAVLVAWALFWFALAVFINSRGQSSARNALAMVGLWLTLVIVVPGLVGVALDTLHPPPSRLEEIHEAREASRELERQRSVLVGRHDVDPNTPELTARLIKIEDEMARQAAPERAAHRQQVAARAQVASTLAFLSPAMLVQRSLETLAGSGTTRHHRFEAQVEDYHDRFRTWTFDHARAGTTMTPALLREAPTFTFEEEPVGALAGRVLAAVLGLLLLVGGLVVASRSGLRRIGRLTS